jgi:hypothetical protein
MRSLPSPLSAGSVQYRAETALPTSSPGQRLDSMASPRTAIDANTACRGGKQQTNGTTRAWCPESLVDPDTLSVRDGQKH